METSYFSSKWGRSHNFFGTSILLATIFLQFSSYAQEVRNDLLPYANSQSDGMSDQTMSRSSADAIQIKFAPDLKKESKRILIDQVTTDTQDTKIPTLYLQTVSRQNPIWGFGASLTESCSENLNQLEPETLNYFMNQVVSSKGARLNVIRVPVGSSDYSVDNYSYEETRGQFSMARDTKTLNLLEKFRAVNPELKVILSPWSPPSWMKTSGRLNGGYLKKEFYSTYTEYLIKVVKEYKRRNIPILGMTIQNEPYYQDTRYPTCGFGTSEQIDFIADFLGPALKAAAPEVRILAIDHNFNLADEAMNILSSRAKSFVGGVAFHCYGGSAEETKGVVDTGTPVIQTECSGVDGNPPSGDFFWWMNNMFINPLKYGYAGSMGWNLCLGVGNVPRNQDGHDLCTTCRGLTTIDKDNQKFELNPEFHAMSLISHWVVPGSKMVLSRWSTQSTVNAVVFETPKAERIIILSNDTPWAPRIRVQLDKSSSLNLVLEPSSTLAVRLSR